MDEGLNFALLRDALITLAVVAAVAFVLSIRRSTVDGTMRIGVSGTAWLTFLGVCAPLAAIAFATGYLTGFSRQPAVTATIPAILTLFGVVFAYVSEMNPTSRGPLATGIVLFALILVLTTNYYATVRETERVKRLLVLSEQERIIKVRRENIGLDKDPPNWMLPGEMGK
ncbi:MAG TPA: hypothetical protein VFK86_17455 [Bauldia sp.]|nr:hypothetical protein [Bauldia sp.]